MTVAITREDIHARLDAMPPSARGRRALEALLRDMTCEELRIAREVEQMRQCDHIGEMLAACVEMEGFGASEGCC